jgi:putative oxidoreductase
MHNTGVRVAESDSTMNVGDLEKMDKSVVTERHGTTTLSRLKWYETTARYVLGAIFLFGAVDGALFLLFGIYLHGKPGEPFLIALQQARYFWAFLKSMQLVGAVSLLTNYKPALGVAVLIPISSVMCLFYLFELPGFIPFGIIIAIATIVLCRAYSKSYAHILDNYSY